MQDKEQQEEGGKKEHWAERQHQTATVVASKKAPNDVMPS